MHGICTLITTNCRIWEASGRACKGDAFLMWLQVRLCPEHALQLNHRKNQEAMRQQRKALKKEQRRKGGRDSDGGGEGALHAEAASSGRKRQRAGDEGAAAPLPRCFTSCSTQAY